MEGSARAVLAAGAVGAVAAVVGAAGAGNDAIAARNGDILFLRPSVAQDPRERLMVVDQQGGGLRDVTPAEMVTINAGEWSPDGRRIAFSGRRVGDIAGEIYVMSADGSGLMQVTRNSLGDGEPSWSPDGRSLVFTAYRTGLKQVYTMRADGSRQRMISRWPDNECAEPAWSPAGRWIVFSCKLTDWTLVISRPDGSGQRRLFRSPYRVQNSSPTWSPDGKLIAFSRWTRSKAMGIWTIRPDGRGLRRLRATGSDPEFSPDGRWLAFTWLVGEQQDIYKARLGGAGLTNLTRTSDGTYESSPPGSRADARLRGGRGVTAASGVVSPEAPVRPRPATSGSTKPFVGARRLNPFSRPALHGATHRVPHAGQESRAPQGCSTRADRRGR